MPNLRIVSDNALERATLTASSTAGVLVVANVANWKKSNVWRALTKNARVDALWSSPEAVQVVAAPFCNWSPTALWRIRTSNEAAVTNLASYSDDIANGTGWPRAAMNAPTANFSLAPDGSMNGDRVIPTNVAGNHYLDKSLTGLPDNTIYAGSIFLKRDTLWRAVFTLVAKDGSGTSLEINFEDGRLSRMSNGTGQACDFKLWDIGGGWYRLGIEKWNTMTGATVPRMRVFASQHNELSLSGWGKAACTSARVGTEVSPYANWLVDNLIEDTTATASHYAACTLFTDVNKAMVVEQTMKVLGAGVTRYGVMLFTSGSGLAANRYAIVNLSTGVITAKLEGTECVFTTENMGNGYWRLKCVFTPKLKGATSWQIRFTDVPTTAASVYTGDGVSGMLLCKPYASLVVPDNTWAPFSAGAEGSVVGDGTTGFLAWGAQWELGQRVTSYYPTTTVATTRPAGYIDTWQSYDYDSGWVLACPWPAVKLRGFTSAQAASAYAFGGGTYARHWLPAEIQARGLAIEIADPGNAQGYLEAACAVAGPIWSPKYNASGIAVTPLDSSENVMTGGGDTCGEIGFISAEISIDLTYMEEPDRATLRNMARNSSIYPLLISGFPNDPDPVRERDHMIYATRAKSSAIALKYAAAYTTSITFKEV